MTETKQELNDSMLSRLRMMAIDKGDTWDLSLKDQAAIQYALDRIEELTVVSEVENSKTIDCLNEAFARDPVAIHSLLSNRVPCNQQLADDPFVIVGHPRAIPNPELWEATALGLLNGVLTANGLPVVASKWSDPSPEERLELLGFCAAGVQAATRSW